MTAKDDGDGIPWDQPLELVKILNAPAVVRIKKWKDVGLELGVKEYVLDRIDRDCRGRTNDCKREMFSHWLKTELQPSWKKVSRALKRARKMLEGACELEKRKKHIDMEESKALDAIGQLKGSLKVMDNLNANILDNQTKLADEWKKQKRKLNLSQTKWKREDMKWEEGAERRQQIMEVLETHILKESQFVKHFLQEKGLSVNLSDQDVKCYLHKDILEKEIARSKQMRSRYQSLQKHHEELRCLLDALYKGNKQTETYLTEVYTETMKLLEEVGLIPNTDFQQQLKNLENTLKDCKKAVKTCDQALREAQNQLRNCGNQLTKFSKSFGEVVEHMEKVIKRWEKSWDVVIVSEAVEVWYVRVAVLVATLVAVKVAVKAAVKVPVAVAVAVAVAVLVALLNLQLIIPDDAPLVFILPLAFLLVFILSLVFLIVILYYILVLLYYILVYILVLLYYILVYILVLLYHVLIAIPYLPQMTVAIIIVVGPLMYYIYSLKTKIRTLGICKEAVECAKQECEELSKTLVTDTC